MCPNEIDRRSLLSLFWSCSYPDKCIPKECAENPSSRNVRSGVHGCTHGCIHSCLRSHSHNEARQPDDTYTESGDHGSSSFSEFRYLFKWLQKSLPYILILGVKLVMQHITGISLGIGLLTTFIYANKSIINQVFLRVSITSN